MHLVTFDYVDNETGQVLATSKPIEVQPHCKDTPVVFSRYIDSLYRGICQGRSVALVINAKPYKPPIQKDIF